MVVGKFMSAEMVEHDLRAADLLCKVKTSEEVMEITGAYFQYYRETGIYLERTSKWVERMGLDTIKAVIEDKQNRRMS